MPKYHRPLIETTLELTFFVLRDAWKRIKTYEYRGLWFRLFDLLIVAYKLTVTFWIRCTAFRCNRSLRRLAGAYVFHDQE
jgi:hypothetical protein